MLNCESPLSAKLSCACSGLHVVNLPIPGVAHPAFVAVDFAMRETVLSPITGAPVDAFRSGLSDLRVELITEDGLQVTMRHLATEDGIWIEGRLPIGLLDVVVAPLGYMLSGAINRSLII